MPSSVYRCISVFQVYFGVFRCLHRPKKRDISLATQPQLTVYVAPSSLDVDVLVWCMVMVVV